MTHAQGEPFSVTILAGGFGTRLGRDKASALAAGRPLLHWMVAALAPLTDDLLVVRRTDQTLPPAPDGVTWREITDEREARGPLAGIEVALSAVRHDLAVIAAADMPLIRPELVRAVAAAAAGHDVALPVVEDFDQPLLAAYRRSCLPAVRATLDGGRGKIGAIFPGLRVRRLGQAEVRRHDADLRSFSNVNRPEDLERVGAVLASQRAGWEDREE